MNETPTTDMGRKTALLILLVLALVHANVASFRLMRDHDVAGHPIVTEAFERATHLLAEEAGESELASLPVRWLASGSRDASAFVLALNTMLVAAAGPLTDITPVTSILLTLLAAAGCYGVGSSMHSRRAGLLAAGLFVAASHVLALRLRAGDGLAVSMLVLVGMALVLRTGGFRRPGVAVAVGLAWGLMATIHPMLPALLILPALATLLKHPANATGLAPAQPGFLCALGGAAALTLLVIWGVDLKSFQGPIVQHNLEGALSLYFASLTHPVALLYILFLAAGVVLAIPRLQGTPYGWMPLNLFLSVIVLFFLQLPMAAGLVSLALAIPLAVTGWVLTLESLKRPETPRKVFLVVVLVMVVSGWLLPMTRLNPVMSETFLSREMARALYRLEPSQSIVGPLTVGSNTGLMRTRLDKIKHPLHLAIVDGQAETAQSRPGLFLETNPTSVAEWGDYQPVLRFPHPSLTEPVYEFQWELEDLAPDERLRSFALYRLGSDAPAEDTVVTPRPPPNFGDRVRLYGFHWDRRQALPGDVIAATGVWEIVGEGVGNLESYLHVYDFDTLVHAENYPFEADESPWMVQRMDFTLPADVPRGVYDVQIGVWKPPDTDDIVWRTELMQATYRVEGALEVE